MCDKVQSVAKGVLEAEYPVLVTFLDDIGVGQSIDGIAAENAWKALEADVDNFVPGSVITDVEAGLNAFESIWNVIPIPEDAKAIGDVILVAAQGVLGLLGGSSVPAGTATEVEVKAHQAAYISHASAQLQAAAPGFKISRMDRVKVFTDGGESVGKDKFKELLDPVVEKSDPKYLNLKVA